MKTISSYITERLKISSAKPTEETFDPQVPADVRNFCESLINGLDYSKLQVCLPSQPDRYDIMEGNINMLKENFNGSFDDFKAISFKEHCDMISKNASEKWKNMSPKDQRSFYEKYGDIAILDKDDKPICFISIRIGYEFIGNVKLESLVSFVEDGYYICIDRKSKESIFISHNALVERAKEKPDILHHSIGFGPSYKKFSIEWEGRKLDSNYYIPSYEIRKFE